MVKRSRENPASADQPEVVQLGEGVTDLIVKMRSTPDGASIKDAFLWELLRNAAFALVQVRLESLVDKDIHGSDPELFIDIVPDKKNGTLTIIDSGIGMTYSDLKKSLCKVRALWLYMQNIDKYAGVDDLSSLYPTDKEFSLGFHSAYMVADKVVVTTKCTGHDQYVWELSNDCDSFTIARDISGERLVRGTKVTLFLNEKHRKYTEEHILNDLIKKYAECLIYPIHILVDDDDQKIKKKKKIVDDEKQKEERVPIEELQVKFEGLRKKFKRFIGSRVKEVVVSDRIPDLANNLSVDLKTFEINPRSSIMEKLRQKAEDKSVDEKELKRLILVQYQDCIYNIYMFDWAHGTSYGAGLTGYQAICF